MYTRHFLVVGLVMLLLLTPGTIVQAQDGSEIPQITIEATADGLAAPDEIPEGIVQITFVNHSEAPVAPVIARLNEGITLDDFMEVESQGGEPSLEEALQNISMLGVAFVMPEMTVDVTFDFAPGTYVLVNTLNEEQIQSFTVVDGEGNGAMPPEADVEAGLVDFAFNMPIEIPAGPQLWHIQNTGDQPHEMLVVPLDENMTAGEFNQLLLQLLASDEEEEPAEGEGPEPVIFWAMSPGEQTWITFDLEPGTYAVVCSFPDTSGSGHVHAELGMRQIIIVTE
jgi:plastocyanin